MQRRQGRRRVQLLEAVKNKNDTCIVLSGVVGFEDSPTQDFVGRPDRL
jgi:hypothetical protein